MLAALVNMLVVVMAVVVVLERLEEILVASLMVDAVVKESLLRFLEPLLRMPEVVVVGLQPEPTVLMVLDEEEPAVED
jgi:hypothetical protein